MTEEIEDFIEALDLLDAALDENIERARLMKRRMEAIREAHAAGRPLSEVVPAEEPPLIVQLLTDSAHALNSCGTRVRRAEARALHREGLTMEEIARHFGVTRQRVSALLREP